MNLPITLQEDRRKNPPPVCSESDVLCIIEELKYSHLELKKNQAAIKEALDRNTELTEEIRSIIESVKGFFNFCAKAGKFGVRAAKIGTVLSVALVSAYHAIDAVASHNISDLFKGVKK